MPGWIPGFGRSQGRDQGRTETVVIINMNTREAKASKTKTGDIYRGSSVIMLSLGFSVLGSSV